MNDSELLNLINAEMKLTDNDVITAVSNVSLITFVKETYLLELYDNN